LLLLLLFGVSCIGLSPFGWRSQVASSAMVAVRSGLECAERLALEGRGGSVSGFSQSIAVGGVVCSSLSLSVSLCFLFPIRT
jgi:hypothetical protein